MRSTATIVLLLIMLAGCTSERLPGDGSTLTMNSMPPAAREFRLASPSATAGSGDAALEQQRDQIAHAWCERLRTARYATLSENVERAAVVSRRSPPLIGSHEPRITGRWVARAEVIMGPQSVWIAGWACDRDGSHDPDHPQMKLTYEGRAVRERAWQSSRQCYRSSWYAPWHPFGTDDFHALDSTHGCMVGSSTQTWLGESHQRDHYLTRLADCTLLPDTHRLGEVDCRVLQWVHESIDPATGQPTYRHEENHYFDDQSTYRGRDVRVWGRSEKGREFRIFQRGIKTWEFFAAEPPRLASFRDWLGEGREDPSTASEPKLPLAGERAPDITLTMMDGQTARLIDLAAEGPVVLDFWATWCGPCRAAMPIVERVSNHYRQQGVRLIAVNLREAKAQVSEFLAKEPIGATVALDEDGRAAAALQVHSIPRLFVIGKDLRIRAVHYGMSEDLEQQLRQNLHDATGAVAQGVIEADLVGK